MNEMLCCSKCGVEKEATSANFYWRKETQSWRKQCINCRVAVSKQWEEKNIDKVTAWRKAWNEKYNKEYYRKNYEKEKSRAQSKPKHLKAQYQRVQKLKPKNRIRGNISRNISYHLKDVGGKRRLSHLKYVDWTYQDLIASLESKFDTWMSWDNYGPYNSKAWDDNDVSTWTWQIDHIKPHSYFQYSSMDENDFKKCWALENLRPYSAKQNIIDGNRRG